MISWGASVNYVRAIPLYPRHVPQFLPLLCELLSESNHEETSQSEIKPKQNAGLSQRGTAYKGWNEANIAPSTEG